MRLPGRTTLTTLREEASTRLWPVPLVGLVLALLAGVAIPELDARVDPHLPPWLTPWLFGGGASAARTVLGAITTSLITVTSLTFSLTVVTLQLASSQYSPRLLRTFTRDRFVHRTLALFLSSFVYAMTVLRTVRAPDEGDDFVPQIAVTLAFALTIASALALVLFLAHLAREIRVETILRNVHSEAQATARRVLDGDGDADREPPTPTSDAVDLTAPSSGFLTGVDHERLVAVAAERDVLVSVQRPVGSPLVAGTALGSVWPRGGGLLADDDLDAVRACWDGALRIGYERTGDQDLGFGLRQLTDVVVRALSPGINDPTTAVHALHHSTALLCELLAFRLGPRTHADAEGTNRLVVAVESLADLLTLAVREPLHHGQDDPVVPPAVHRLLDVVEERAGRPEHREAVAEVRRRLAA